MTKLTPMDMDALREAYANNPHNLFAEQVVWCLDELKVAREQLGQQATAPGVKEIAERIVSVLYAAGKSKADCIVPKKGPVVSFTDWVCQELRALAVAPPPVGLGKEDGAHTPDETAGVTDAESKGRRQ